MVTLAGGKRFPAGNAIAKIVRNDRSKPDLQPEAAVQLANILADLAQTERYAEMLDAIRSRPAAWLSFSRRPPKTALTRSATSLVSLSDQLKTEHLCE
jgi:hypothetical protein